MPNEETMPTPRDACPVGETPSSTESAEGHGGSPDASMSADGGGDEDRPSTSDTEECGIKNAEDPAHASEAAFGHLLEEAVAVQKDDRGRVGSILRRGLDLHLTGGQFALLIDTLAKAAGFKSETVGQMKKDVASTFRDYGVLPTASKAAGAFLHDLKTSDGAELVYQDSCFYAFEKGDIHFTRYTDAEMASSVELTLPHHPLVQREGSRKEIVRRLSDLCRDEAFFGLAAPGLTLANGHLAIDAATGAATLLPHGPEHRSRFALSFGHDEAADCPVFLVGLERVMPDAQSRDALQEILGCAAFNVGLPGDNACSVAVLQGPANCGKSSLLSTVAALFPPEQICCIQPSQLGEPFMLAELHHKRLNVVTELDHERPFGGALFRAVAGREGVTARAIYRGWGSLTPEAYHLLAGNILPRSKDTTSAFRRRLRCFRFPRSLEASEIDGRFRELVATEMPGVLNWLVAGARRAIQRGSLAVPPEHGEIVARIQYGDDAVTAFVATSFERVEGTRRLSTQAIFAALCQFAEARGVDIRDWNTTTNGRRISELLHALHGIGSPSNVGGVPHYRGIALR